MNSKSDRKNNTPAADSAPMAAEHGPLRENADNKLEYVRHMLMELRRIAVDTGEGTLVYMIEMAALEAEECARIRKLGSRMTE